MSCLVLRDDPKAHEFLDITDRILQGQLPRLIGGPAASVVKKRDVELLALKSQSHERPNAAACFVAHRLAANDQVDVFGTAVLVGPTATLRRVAEALVAEGLAASSLIESIDENSAWF